jgi:hypothetical protein
VAISSTGVTKDGNWRDRAAEKVEGKGKESAKDGPSSSKREGGGRRRGRLTHGHGAGLLQLRNLTSYLLLRSSSAWPSSPSYAHRSKLREHTPPIKNPSPSRAYHRYGLVWRLVGM